MKFIDPENLHPIYLVFDLLTLNPFDSTPFSKFQLHVNFLSCMTRTTSPANK